MKEAKAALHIAKLLISHQKSFKIITPYDVQRIFIENLLKENELSFTNTCFNVDSFQGM